MSLPLAKLRTASPSPSEAQAFAQTEAVEPSIMIKAWSESAVASVVLGSRVRITSGEQADCVGKVSKVNEDIITIISKSCDTPIEAPFASVRLHFLVGDYIEVVAGSHVGKFGGVINVEHRLITDVVTFVSIQHNIPIYDDDLSIPRPEVNPLPETVSSSTLRDYVSFFFR